MPNIGDLRRKLSRKQYASDQREIIKKVRKDAQVLT